MATVVGAEPERDGERWAGIEAAVVEILLKLWLVEQEAKEAHEINKTT